MKEMILCCFGLLAESRRQLKMKILWWRRERLSAGPSHEEEREAVCWAFTRGGERGCLLGLHMRRRERLSAGPSHDSSGEGGERWRSASDCVKCPITSSLGQWGPMAVYVCVCVCVCVCECVLDSLFMEEDVCS